MLNIIRFQRASLLPFILCFILCKPKQIDKPDKTSHNGTALWLNVPYFSHEGEFIVNRLIKKLKFYFKTNNVCIEVFYETININMFCSNKDKIPTLNKSNLIYQFSLPGYF